MQRTWIGSRYLGGESLKSGDEKNSNTATTHTHTQNALELAMVTLGMLLEQVGHAPAAMDVHRNY
jgi:hypothetical protein